MRFDQLKKTKKEESLPEKESPKLTNKDILTSVTDVIYPKSPGLILQDRDYEILKFILEQKFSSLEAIYFRFFDARKNPEDPLPKNLWTTRQRLAKLRGSALIKTEKVLSSGKAHFLLTSAGYKILSQRMSESFVIKPSQKIDFSLYEHDVRVMMIRAFLEARGKSKRWYSEKWLKATPIFIENYKYKFSKDLRPDALFINSKAERVALELEISRKGIRRIKDKVRLYEGLLREQDGFLGNSMRPQVCHKVWVIVTKPAIYRGYKRAIEEVASSPHLYRLDFYDEVIPECAR